MAARISAVLLLVLGIAIWTGKANELILVHIGLGLVFVIALWALAAAAMGAGVNHALVVVAFCWGLVMPALGLLQASLVPGQGHIAIQLLHLLVGLVGLALAESLGRRMRLKGRPA